MRNILTITALMVAFCLIMTPYVPTPRFIQIMKAQAAESADSGSGSSSAEEPPEAETDQQEHNGQWIGIAILFVLVVIAIFKMIFGGSV